MAKVIIEMTQKEIEYFFGKDASKEDIFDELAGSNTGSEFYLNYGELHVIGE